MSWEKAQILVSSRMHGKGKCIDGKDTLKVYKWKKKNMVGFQVLMWSAYYTLLSERTSGYGRVSIAFITFL